MDIDLQLEHMKSRARERSGGQPIPLRDWVALAEAWRIAEALRDAHGNRTAAARSLGIGRRTLYSKMEKLGLTPVWMVAGTAQGLGSGDAPGGARAGRNEPDSTIPGQDQHSSTPARPLATFRRLGTLIALRDA